MWGMQSPRGPITTRMQEDLSPIALNTRPGATFGTQVISADQRPPARNLVAPALTVHRAQLTVEPLTASPRQQTHSSTSASRQGHPQVNAAIYLHKVFTMYRGLISSLAFAGLFACDEPTPPAAVPVSLPSHSVAAPQNETAHIES